VTLSPFRKPSSATLLPAVAALIFAAACTPATDDYPVGTGGTSAGGQANGSAGTSTLPSAGSGQSGASTGGSSNPTPGGGAAGSNNAPGGGTASGGSDAGVTGGSVGGSGPAGGAASAVGCGWAPAAADTWTMNPPAADRVMLFDGKDLSNWHKLNEPNTPAQWQVLAAGVIEVVPSTTPTNIQSKATFDDVCVHVEYKTPRFSSGVDVQKQGNSGVYLKSAYEMQILDTHADAAFNQGCGAVYLVSAPKVVACNQFEVWNTYEIEFKSSVWQGQTKTSNALYEKVTLNGKLVQEKVSLNPPGGFTEAGIPDKPGPQPLALQDHRELVQFRNIWVAVPHY
jgi:hypothetical protein